jgi:hypothetical protein
MMTAHIRWGDNDRYLGPFTYARDTHWCPLGIVMNSGDGDERRKCQIRFSAFGHTLIAALPPIIRPWRRKIVVTSWDAATVARLGRDWYWDAHPREYGFSCSEGHFNLYLGRQTGDSSTEQRWSTFLPWTQWRHIRHNFYGLAGEHYWTEPTSRKGSKLGGPNNWYDVYRAAKDACPSQTFAFADFDGEALTVRTIIEEREWRFGTGWFKWLSLFRKPKISRSLDLEFSGETGKRKGSWKGGTVGHSIEMLSGELHKDAFRRYCDEHEMTFGVADG